MNYGPRESDWYAEYSSAGKGRSNRDRVAQAIDTFLNPGQRLLDVGCGYGPHGEALKAKCVSLTGVDESSDLLVRIGSSYNETILADATRLPFPDSSFDRVVTSMTTTDFSDWRGAVAEMSRVTSDLGEILVVGAHPCFAGPSSTRDREGGVRVDGGYWDTSFRPPSRFERGIRSKVGSRGMTLVSMLDPFTEEHCVLNLLSEGVHDQSDPPHIIIVRFRRLARTEEGLQL